MIALKITATNVLEVERLVTLVLRSLAGSIKAWARSSSEVIVL